MSNSLYEEAIADAKKIREVAEENAKKAILEAVTPKIKEFIENEVQEIEKLKNLSKPIIPEIDFTDLGKDLNKIKQNIHKRGCVIIRNVFEDKKIDNLNKELEEYIKKNGYYKDQKLKTDLDKYFSDLKSGKPQIYGLYWSKTQIEIRHSNEMAKVKIWLNNLWNYKNKE